MEALILGDTHGSLSAIREAILACQTHSVKKIFQLGDFGYWEHTPEGKMFLDLVDKWLRLAGLTLDFIDGNHENHRKLREYPDLGGYSQIRETIRYLHRGSIHTFGSTEIACLGGAWSIDKDSRVEGHSWWPEELIDVWDLDKFEGQTADVMFSHEVPSSVDLNTQLILQGKYPYTHIPISFDQRVMVQQAIDHLEVTEVYHGHHHIRYTNKPYNGLTVTGLACDGHGKDSWTIKDF